MRIPMKLQGTISKVYYNFPCDDARKEGFRVCFMLRDKEGNEQLVIGGPDCSDELTLQKTHTMLRDKEGNEQLVIGDPDCSDELTLQKTHTIIDEDRVVEVEGKTTHCKGEQLVMLSKIERIA